MGFTYDTLPADHSCIRLLTLLPGSATIGKGDPLICLLTTHIWDPKTGRIHYTHAAGSESRDYVKQVVEEASPGGDTQLAIKPRMFGFSLPIIISSPRC
jgi:hypothetical protein